MTESGRVEPSPGIGIVVRDAAVVRPVLRNLPSISVIGLGYVGAVSTACLAKLGHTVIGCDVDEIKADQIARGESPIHEKDLGDLLSLGVEAGLVSATTDVARPKTALSMPNSLVLFPVYV